MKYKDLSLKQKTKLAFALLRDKDKGKIFNFNSNKFKFVDIPTKIKTLKKDLKESSISQKLQGITPLVDKIQEFLNPKALCAESLEDLEIEVDIWYDVMYLNKDEKGKKLKTTEDVKEAQDNLIKRVGNISNWDISKVKDLSSLFRDKKYFNDDISKWDVSNVRDMSYMFYNAAHFNGSLNDWDTSNVENMENMFEDALRFNQNLDNWNMSNVTNTQYMFLGANSFNKPLNNWERKENKKKGMKSSTVRNIVNMHGMFSNAESFDQPLNQWVLSDKVNFLYMFESSGMSESNLPSWYNMDDDGLGDM